MSTFIYPPIPISISPSGTEATSENQLLEIAELEAINSELDAQTSLLTSIDTNTAGLSDIATETTLSALNAKVTAVDTGAVVVSSSALPTGASTSALQTSGNASLSSIDTKTVVVDTDNVTVVSSALPTGAATETTLSSLNSKVTAVNTGAVVVASSALPTGAATETTLSALNAKVTAVNTGAVTISAALPAGNNNIGDVDIASLPGTVSADIAALNARIAGSLVPFEQDYIGLTYVAAGDGVGEIETVTYKTGGAAGTTTAVLTLAYDSSNRLSSVTRS